MSEEKKISAERGKTKVPRTFHVSLKAEGHTVLCNDKPLMTPKGRPYILPTAVLAEAIAAEWRAQADDKIDAAQMPLTCLAATSIDIVAEHPQKTAEALVVYASTDLLCHRADGPQELAARQQTIWQPLLDWCALTFGALLQAGSGIMPIRQSAESIAALDRAVAALDPFRLVGLQSAVDTTGSLVLGLALAHGARDAAEVFHAAELDVLFQRDSWGLDPVTEARLDSVRAEIDAAARWFALLGQAAD